jgi:hypothetical protein
VRLVRGGPVAGLDPEFARQVARLCRSGGVGPQFVANKTDVPVEQAQAALDALTEHGFLKVDEARGWWSPTVAGGALAQASFMRPISRKKADELLAAVRERAQQYNEDSGKPLVIAELRVFGSYLDPDAAQLGDLDLHLTVSPRDPGSDSAAAVLDYAEKSGRTFGTFFQMLAWAQTEVRLTLRARNPYIHITDEPLDGLTDRWQVVFTDQAVPEDG